MSSKIDTNEARRMLDILDGNPPFDRPDNICRNDAIYGRNIERKFGMTVKELRKAVGR